ncbi:MAG: hypothetical protein PHS50_10735, partial [Kiritimatiellae bacterium]|nr:hypothetical protein [Kiritimatiellia bacterium]
MIVSNYLSLSCPCFMGGTPMPRGVLQEPQTKKFGVRRQAVFRATPLFEQCLENINHLSDYISHTSIERNQS